MDKKSKKDYKLEALEKAIQKQNNKEQQSRKESLKSKNKSTENDASKKVEQDNEKRINEKKLEIRERLMNEILNQEKSMRIPREEMKNKILSFLLWQLIFLGIVVILVLYTHGHCAWFPGTEYITTIDFIMFLTTSIIAEFIAMIFFIVKYLFNTKLIEVLSQWYKDL